MESTHLIGLLAAVLLLISLLVFGLWRHKRASAGEVKLMGEMGLVETKLDPQGTIIVDGELWNAQSSDGSDIEVNARVRVVGMQAHLVLVETCQSRLR
ncbi:MAG TPA: NfeD family protein [Pyrinomonadaceae bacterium]|nr:NfeD family protein [Pyrinomonadaceae bacterium]